MAERVHYEQVAQGATQVASIRLDDGKANVMQMAFFAELHQALNRAESAPVHAVVLSTGTT